MHKGNREQSPNYNSVFTEGSLPPWKRVCGFKNQLEVEEGRAHEALFPHLAALFK